MANYFTKPEQRTHWNEYNRKYSNENYKSVCLKLNKKKDKDIIDYLAQCGKTPTELFKSLLREKIGTGK